MQILKGAITTLAEEGRLDLQVPQFDLNFDGSKSMTQTIPDDWIVSLREQCPVIGKQQGFWFLSRIGWEANKNEIKKAFLSCPSHRQRGTWSQFLDHAERHFKKVAENIEKKIKFHQLKLQQLQEVQKKYGIHHR